MHLRYHLYNSAGLPGAPLLVPKNYCRRQMYSRMLLQHQRVRRRWFARVQQIWHRPVTDAPQIQLWPKPSAITVTLHVSVQLPGDLNPLSEATVSTPLKYRSNKHTIETMFIGPSEKCSWSFTENEQFTCLIQKRKIYCGWASIPTASEAMWAC
jgi:hypothetical protein